MSLIQTLVSASQPNYECMEPDVLRTIEARGLRQKTMVSPHEIDEEEAYNFVCRTNDGRNVDTTATRALQLYIAHMFKENLPGGVFNRDARVESIGTYQIKSMENGLSFKISKPEELGILTEIVTLNMPFVLYEDSDSIAVNCVTSKMSKPSRYLRIRPGENGGQRTGSRRWEASFAHARQYLLTANRGCGAKVLFVYSGPQIRKMSAKKNFQQVLKDSGVLILLHPYSWENLENMATSIVTRYRDEHPGKTRKESTPREQIAYRISKEESSLYGFQGRVLALWDEFASVTRRQVAAYKRGPLIHNENIETYCHEMDSIPPDFEAVGGGKFAAFHFTGELDSSIHHLADRLSAEDLIRASTHVISMPDFRSTTPAEVMASNLFPFNIPSVYIREKSRFVQAFDGNDYESFNQHMGVFTKMIETTAYEEDITLKGRRLPGSYGFRRG